MKNPTAEEINKLPMSLSTAAVAAHFGIPIELVVSARAKAVKPFKVAPTPEVAPSGDSAHLQHREMMRRGSRALLEATHALLVKMEREKRRAVDGQG